jgi:WD40 repeat protein
MYKDLTPKSEVIFPGRIGHLFSVMRLASFKSSLKFASSSFDGTVRIWKNEEQQKVLFYFSEAIEGLEITPDDKKIIVILGDSSKAYIYNLEANEMKEIGENLVLRNLFGTNSSCTKTAFVTFDDDVYIYDHNTGVVDSCLFVENVSGDSLVWINDNKVCIPKRNGSIVVINSIDKKIEQEVQVHDGLITSICIDNDNLVTVSEDGTGKILDLEFNAKFGFKINFTPLSVDYNAQVGLVSVSGDRNLLIVNIKTGDIINKSLDLSGCNSIITNDFKIIKGTGENDITIFSDSGEPISKIKGRSLTAELVADLGNNRVVLASGDKKVHLLDYSLDEDQTLATHKEPISSVLYVPLKDYIISGAYDDTIAIWDLQNHAEVKRIKGLQLVTALAGSPSDDLFVVACSGDNTLHIFSTEGKSQTSWEAHEDFISSVLFMNEEVIISGSDDGTLKFWKLNGKLISSIQTGSPVKAIDTTLEYDFNITGHLNGELNFYEKITNRKVNSYNVDRPVQRIKIIDNSYVLFASQNILYLMHMDGYHIVDVFQICEHTEPVRSIFWYINPPKIISFAHNIEIIETQFLPSTDLPSLSFEEVESEETTSTTVMFAPGESDETQLVEVSENDSYPAQTATLTPTDIEHLTNILEYLNAVDQQVKDLITPKLQIYGIDSKKMQATIEKVQDEINKKLKGSSELHEPIKDEKVDKEKEADWTSIDWGHRKR